MERPRQTRFNRPSVGGLAAALAFALMWCTLGSTTGADAAAPLPDTEAPRLTNLALSPSVFQPDTGAATITAKLGVTATYLVSEPGEVEFTIEKRKGDRYVPLRGAIYRTAFAGVNRFRFKGGIDGRRLTPGRFRLVVTPIDLAGNRGAAKRKGFKVVR